MKMPHLILGCLLLLNLHSCQRITVEDFSPMPEELVKPTGLIKSWNVPLTLASDQMATLESIKVNEKSVVTVHTIMEKETYKRLFYQISIHDKMNGSLQSKITLPYDEDSRYFASLHAFGNGCLYESSDSFYCINTEVGKITKVFSAKEFGVKNLQGPVTGRHGLYLYDRGDTESQLIHCIPEKGMVEVYRSGTTLFKHIFGIWTNGSGADVLVGAANVTSTQGQITLWDFKQNKITPLYTITNTPGGWSGDYEVAGDFVYLNTEKRIKGFHLTDSTQSWMYVNANVDGASEHPWKTKYILHNDGVVWISDLYLVEAIDAKSGKFLYSAETDFQSMGRMAFLGNQRFCYFRDNHLKCHDQKSGALLWVRNMNFEDGSAAPPGTVKDLAADDHSIYFCNERGLFAYQY